MPTPDQEQAFKLQEEFVSRMEKDLAQMREGHERTPAAVVREAKARIERAESRLAAAKQERDETLQVLDERIAGHTRVLERMRQEAAEAERNIKEARRRPPDR
jgi:hypothetical protein